MLLNGTHSVVHEFLRVWSWLQEFFQSFLSVRCALSWQCSLRWIPLETSQRSPAVSCLSWELQQGKMTRADVWVDKDIKKDNSKFWPPESCPPPREKRKRKSEQTSPLAGWVVEMPISDFWKVEQTKDVNDCCCFFLILFITLTGV